MATSGQTINDRLNAVRYALVGQGLARTVYKATTEEILGPKKKHIDYLIACTNEPNVSIPQMANLLIERTQHLSWAVVFKALITIHQLMSFGNEKFCQYLATSNHSFNLADFMDRTTQGYNMSAFVRRYSKYVDDKCASYRTLAIDLCKIKSGNDNALRTMNLEKLNKTLPIVQTQFDSLLEFGAELKDLNNGIINAAFRLLYKDLVRLYIAYQEAIINLLERYFNLSRKKTREALVLYKNYLARMDKVAGFLQIVDAVGLDKSEMPDLTKSPASILKLLEEHLAQLEAKKKGSKGGAASTSATPDIQQHQDSDQDDAGETIKQTEASPQDQAQASEPAAKQTAPPPKPARPSPRSSPKVSPVRPPASSGSSGPVDSEKAPTPTTSLPTEKAQVIDKQPVAAKSAGPPQRPAKPPSRPPQPAPSTSSHGPPPPPPPPPPSAVLSSHHNQPPPPPPPPPQPKHHGKQPEKPAPPAPTVADAPASQPEPEAAIESPRTDPVSSTTASTTAAAAAAHVEPHPAEDQPDGDQPGQADGVGAAQADSGPQQDRQSDVTHGSCSAANASTSTVAAVAAPSQVENNHVSQENDQVGPDERQAGEPVEANSQPQAEQQQLQDPGASHLNGGDANGRAETGASQSHLGEDEMPPPPEPLPEEEPPVQPALGPDSQVAADDDNSANGVEQASNGSSSTESQANGGGAS